MHLTFCSLMLASIKRSSHNHMRPVATPPACPVSCSSVAPTLDYLREHLEAWEVSEIQPREGAFTVACLIEETALDKVLKLSGTQHIYSKVAVSET